MFQRTVDRSWRDAGHVPANGRPFLEGCQGRPRDDRPLRVALETSCSPPEWMRDAPGGRASEPAGTRAPQNGAAVYRRSGASAAQRDGASQKWASSTSIYAARPRRRTPTCPRGQLMPPLPPPRMRLTEDAPRDLGAVDSNMERRQPQAGESGGEDGEGRWREQGRRRRQRKERWWRHERRWRQGWRRKHGRQLAEHDRQPVRRRTREQSTEEVAGRIACEARGAHDAVGGRSPAVSQFAPARHGRSPARDRRCVSWFRCSRSADLDPLLRSSRSRM